MRGDKSRSWRGREHPNRRKHSRTREEALDKLKRVFAEEQRIRLRAAGVLGVLDDGAGDDPDS